MLKLHDELIEELTKSLTIQNYNPVVVTNHRLYARRFLDYLTEYGIPVAMVTPRQVDQYFHHAVRCFHDRYGRPPSPRWHKMPLRAIDRLLRLAQGTWPPEANIEPGKMLRHAICRDYEIWMRDERGLADATIDARLREARRFLDEYCDRKGAGGLSSMAVRDIDLYMDVRTRGLCRMSIAASASWLRSLLRYLHQSGRVPTDLSPQVISPTLYAYENIPSILEPGQIALVLETAGRDRSSRGLRDHAILLMLAVYGLRGGEICNLRLDDIDWRADSLRIRHTKTNACSTMPLLTPVGDALLDYLRLARPQAECREIFIRSVAPYTRMKNLYSMVDRRLAAAGVTPVGKRGPHIFRHARAVEMLRATVPQKIIGDVLGHRYTSSTNAYLKLATDDLRAVALDIPGSEVLS